MRFSFAIRVRRGQRVSRALLVTRRPSHSLLRIRLADIRRLALFYHPPLALHSVSISALINKNGRCFTVFVG